MENATEKVTPLRSPGAQEEAIAAEIMDSTSKDMGKVSIFVSILAVVLLAVFYFGMNQTMSGISEKVEEISAVKSALNAFDAKLAATTAAVDNRVGMMESGVAAKLNAFESGLDNRFSAMSAAVDGKVAKVGQRVDQVEGEMAKLSELPAQTKRVMMATMIQELAQTATYLSGEVETSAQKDALQAAIQQLEKARTQLTQ